MCIRDSSYPEHLEKQIADKGAHLLAFDALKLAQQAGSVKAVNVAVSYTHLLVDRVTELGGVTMITADHGNADKMISEDGGPFTAHTTNPVPFCVVGYPCTLKDLSLIHI